MSILSHNFHKILNFVSKRESQLLVQEIDFKLRKMKKYQHSHFDSVIQNYKEMAPSSFSSEFDAILTRMKNSVQKELGLSDIKFNVHILDLACENSGIGAHTDNHTGRFVAGLCLLSPAVMIFRKGQESHPVLLDENCFYIQHGLLRNDYTHEIPFQESQEHSIDSIRVPRARRISILLREELGPLK